MSSIEISENQVKGILCTVGILLPDMQTDDSAVTTSTLTHQSDSSKPVSNHINTSVQQDAQILSDKVPFQADNPRLE